MSIPTRRLDALNPTINPARDHEIAAMRDGISNKLRVEQILALLQSSDIPNDAITTFKIADGGVTTAKMAADALASANHTFDDTAAQLGETDVQGAIDALALILFDANKKQRIIGEVFYLWDHLDGVNPPDNSGAAKFVRLTAGQSGVGGYNEGILSNESVSGSSPFIIAQAEIMIGPLQGQIIELINTARAHLRSGNSGVRQFHMTADHHHARDDYRLATFASSGTRWDGATSDSTLWRTIARTDTPDTWMGAREDTSEGDRISNETRVHNIGATAYMRVA